MAGESNDIIDLSDSFILADHRAISNIVIELDSDDSFIDLVNSNALRTDTLTTLPVLKSGKPLSKTHYNQLKCIYDNNKTRVQNQENNNETISNEKQYIFGDCPICFDPLGVNPLASTKCGHVYCMKCLKQYLLGDRRCPTCRQHLNRKSSYHPLYLNK